MKPQNKGMLGFLIICLVLALSIYFLSGAYEALFGGLVNSLQATSSLAIILILGAFFAVVILLAFLFGMPVMRTDNTQGLLLDTHKLGEGVHFPDKMTINLTVGSGFKFGIGFMLGVALFALVMSPLMLVVFGALISSVLK